jgi:hypothetical protein
MTLAPCCFFAIITTSPVNPLQAIQQNMQRAVARGMNASLEVVLRDLRVNSPVKHRALQQGWYVKETASPERWRVTISNTQFYARYQYPLRIYKEPNLKYPLAYPAPSLFNPNPQALPTGYGVLSQNQVTLNHGEVVRQTIEGAIAQAFRR